MLSTVAGSPLEQVASEASGAPMWFQLYSAGGRTEAEGLIDRAAAAGFRALVVTLDTPVLGNRERDVRHGVVPLHFGSVREMSCTSARRSCGSRYGRGAWHATA